MKKPLSHARTRTLRQWTHLPSAWIQDEKRLTEFQWGKGGSDNTAALMALIIIGQNADETSGVASLTYDDIVKMGHMSRAKVSAGLDILQNKKLINRKSGGRSLFALTNYNPTIRGWAKLPAKKLYTGNRIVALFEYFNLRKRTELDALKIYLLLLAFRDNQTNTASVSYDVIEDYTGIGRNFIRAALTILAMHQLVHFEVKASGINDIGVSHSYRIAFLDPYNHNATSGRGRDIGDELLF